jgi:hypothetical protein
MCEVGNEAVYRRESRWAGVEFSGHALEAWSMSNAILKRVLAEKTLDVGFFKSDLQKIEAWLPRQRAVLQEFFARVAGGRNSDTDRSQELSQRRGHL